MSELIANEWYARNWDYLAEKKDLSAEEIAFWRNLHGERYRRVIGVTPDKRNRLWRLLKRIEAEGTHSVRGAVRHLQSESGLRNGGGESVAEGLSEDDPVVVLSDWYVAPLSRFSDE